MLSRTLPCLCAALASASAAADICRWKDADGTTHYGTEPPPGVACAQKVRPPPPVAPGNAAGARPDFRQLETDFQKRRVERAEADLRAEKARKEAESQREACGQLRGRLAWMEGGGRVATLDANGHRQFYDDQQFARELAALRERISRQCR
jgi:hypothetical protein